MTVQFGNALGEVQLTDYLLGVRDGIPDTTGYVTVEDLITLVQNEISPSDLILVNDVSDLQPYLSGGEYVIPVGKGLCFIKNIVLSAPIRLPARASFPDPANAFTTICGGGFSGTALIQVVYTGTGAFIRGTNSCGVWIDKLNFISVNSANQLFDIQNGSNPATWAAGLLITNCFMTGWTSCGLIEGVNLSGNNSISITSCGNGIQFKNFATLGLTITNWANGQNLANSYMFRLSGIVLRFSLNGPVNMVLGSNESGLYIDTNIYTERLSVIGTSPTGTGKLFHASGLNESSAIVLSKFNPPFPDSKQVAFLNTTTETLTTISASNTFTHIVLPAGGYTTQALSLFSKVEQNVGSGIFDVLVYEGVETVQVAIQAGLTARAASGSPVARLGINLNGTVQPGGYPTTLAATNTNMRSEGIFILNAARFGTYSQSGTAVTLTVNNLDSSGNLLHTAGERQYFRALSGTGVSGLYTITASNATSISYTAGTSLTTSGNMSVHDRIKLDIENQSASTNIYTSNLNFQVIP